ncbi:MAG: hypothetical protein Q9160_006498 [Pyrenula sp. 1 TL-2023]
MVSKQFGTNLKSSAGAQGVVTYTSSKVLSNYLNQAFDSQNVADLSSLSHTTPPRSLFTLGIEADGAAPSQAAASVVCQPANQSTYLQNISNIFIISDVFGDQFLTPSDVQDWNVTIDLSNIRSEMSQAQHSFWSSPDIQWRTHRLTPSSTPEILAFIYIGISWQPAQICKISTKWLAAPQWVMSQDSPNVISGDPYTNMNGSQRSPQANSIQMDISWLETFSAVSEDSNSSVLVSFLMEAFNQAFGNNSVSNITIPVASILSRALSDGISRIGSQYGIYGDPLGDVTDYWGQSNQAIVCRDGWCSEGAPFVGYNPLTFKWTGGTPFMLNWTCDVIGQWTNESSLLNPSECQHLHSFPQPENVEQNWTRITMPLYRYGYGYGFRSQSGTPVILGAAILLFDALLVLIHCGLVIFHGRSFNFIQGLGDLLQRALRSVLSAPFLSDVSKKTSMWAKQMRVQARYGADGRGHLEMIVSPRGEGGQRHDCREEAVLSIVHADKKYD